VQRQSDKNGEVLTGRSKRDKVGLVCSTAAEQQSSSSISTGCLAWLGHPDWDRYVISAAR
jgi:hypothetical protein